MRKYLLLLGVMFVALFLISCARQKETAPQVSDMEKLACEGTVFCYQGVSYELTERNKQISSVREYEKVGKHILITADMGKNASYYGVFQTDTKTFERDIIASNIAYCADDIRTLVYCIENKVYDYDGNLLKEPELSDSEYIYRLYYEGEGKTLYAEIADINSDEKPRVVPL